MTKRIRVKLRIEIARKKDIYAMFKKSIVFVSVMISSWMNAYSLDKKDCNPLNTTSRWRDDYDRQLMQKDTAGPAKIQLEKTSVDTMVILFISDTAKETAELGTIFNKDYGELMRFVSENKLMAKKFLAWHYSTQPPWTMDVAVEIEKVPSGLKGRIKSRIVKGGDVLIAHVWGPYSELSKAYAQIESWLKQNKRTASGTPFEVYLNDPSIVKDPSEIRTDVYQLLQ